MGGNWRLVDFIKEGLVLVLANPLRLAYKLILLLVDGAQVGLHSLHKGRRDTLEFLMLVVAVLVLGQDDELAGKLMQRHNLLPLQLGNVVQHLVLFDLQVVLLDGLHDRSIVGGRILVLALSVRI